MMGEGWVDKKPAPIIHWEVLHQADQMSNKASSQEAYSDNAASYRAALEKRFDLLKTKLLKSRLKTAVLTTSANSKNLRLQNQNPGRPHKQIAQC